MRKFKVALLAMVILAIVAGCGTTMSTLQEQWNKRTPDEQARIIVNGLQEQLDGAFDTGKAFVTANPKYQGKWLKEIVPAFKLANETLADVMNLAKAGQISPDQVYARAIPFINKVANYLVEIGAVKKQTDLFPPIIPYQSAMMDITMILTVISGLLGLAFKLYEYASQIKGDTKIPTWEEIADKNKLLQVKIEKELAQGEKPPAEPV